MKNLKIAYKLILSFLIIIAFSVLIGAIGILGMARINAADDSLYGDNYLPTVLAGDISQLVVEERVVIRNFVIYDVNLNAQQFANAESKLSDLKNQMKQKLSEYEGTIMQQEDQDAFDQLVSVYNNEWLPAVDNILALGKANKTEEAVAALEEAATAADKMDTLTSNMQQLNMDYGEDAVNGNTVLYTTMALIEAGILVVSIAIAVYLSLRISGLISKPVTFMKNVLYEMSARGRVNFSEEEYRQAGIFASSKDEVGQSIQMLINTGRRLEEVGKSMETVAGGDLTAELALLSEADTIGMALEKMVTSLNNMFGEINVATAQVASGSKQIADGSQALAQGSTEQAAAVEQLSSSITEIADKTKTNADMAERAARLAQTIKGSAETGSRQMGEMMTAVKEINDASQNIGKVIKVIDDIAFQTNILALNAAVEAARAGQHGKGFAVVAEEVRNLAAKSAGAAKETGSMIANSIEKAELGSRIAGETASSLSEIVSGINESSVLVGDIAKSSEEQSMGIAQINKGIDQVAQVIQQNSATAEESAAASEEMSGQADMLESLVSQFKLKDGKQEAALPSAGSASRKQLVMPKKTSYAPKDENSGYGKY